MKLVSPNKNFQKSYLEYIQELGSEERYPFPLDFDFNDFEALVHKLENYSKGIELANGHVPSSTYWLVEGNEIVGVTNLRHFLNKEIEQAGGHIGLGIRPSYRGKGLGNLLMDLSVKKLNEFGIKDIHIHCYKHNTASAKTIVANGGELHSEITLEGKIIQRYRVNNNN